LLLPTLNRMLSIEEKQAAQDKFNLLTPFKDHTDIFKVYAFLFIGVLLVFSFFAIALPSIATSQMFEPQVRILGYIGQAYSDDAYFSILVNNLTVFFFCLMASFIYGAGSIFIIIWNASAWGVVFGIVARNSAMATSQNPFAYFLLTFLAVLPHMLSEASAYCLAAISGGVISKAVIKEKMSSPQFNKIVKDGLVIFGLAILILVVAAFIEVYITPYLLRLFGV